MKTISTILILLLLLSAASAYEIDAGRRYGMGGCALLTTPTATNYVDCPIGLLQKKQLIVESGYQRKFELADLDKIFISAGYRLGDFSLSAGVSQFGRSDYYIEQTVRATLSYGYNKYVGALILSGRKLDITPTTGKISLSAASIGLAGGVHYKKYHLGISVDNINQPKLYDIDEKQNILYDFYGEVEGNGRFSLTARLTLEKYEKPVIAIGQYIRLAGHNALFWGISNNPMTYGGGVEVHYHGFGLIYATSYHPILGFTHNVSLNYSKGL